MSEDASKYEATNEALLPGLADQDFRAWDWGEHSLYWKCQTRQLHIADIVMATDKGTNLAKLRL